MPGSEVSLTINATSAFFRISSVTRAASDILILCPDREVTMLSEHVRNTWISGVDPHRKQANSAQRHGSKHEASFNVEVHGISERGEQTEWNTDVEKIGTSALNTRGGDARRRLGLNNEDDTDIDSDGGVELVGLGSPGAVGTARILRRWRDWFRVSCLRTLRRSCTV